MTRLLLEVARQLVEGRHSGSCGWPMSMPRILDVIRQALSPDPAQESLDQVAFALAEQRGWDR